MHVMMEMDLKLQSVEYAVFDEADRYVCLMIVLPCVFLCHTHYPRQKL